MPDDRLPYGKQFSPTQVDLRSLLEAAQASSGDRARFEAALLRAFFDRAGTSKRNRSTLAMNCFLSLRSYELIEGGDRGGAFKLTPVGEQIYRLRTKSGLMHARLAEHIVTRLHGVQLLEVIEAVRARGALVNVTRVAEEMLALGIDPGGPSGENINPVKMWLEKGGLLKGWDIQDAGLRHVIGAGIGEIAELAALPLRERAFLLAMATATGSPPFVAADLRRLAEVQIPSVRFDTKTFAPVLLRRLERDGWLKVAKTTGGRGAKSHEVMPSKRFSKLVSEPLMTSLASQAHLQDPPSLRRPVQDLLKVVRDPKRSSHDRGLALEGVCIQLVRLLGARFVDWRRRGDETSGAEVDVIAELLGNRYDLVQIQSKASRIGGRDVVDREVGVAAALKSDVLVFVSAQDVADAARRAAATHMQESGLAILFFDGADLDRLTSGAELAGPLEREWRRVAAVRSPRTRQRAAAVTS